MKHRVENEPATPREVAGHDDENRTLHSEGST